MEIYYLKKNKLQKLFSKKYYIDNSLVQDRQEKANLLVQDFCQENESITTLPREILISVKLFLYKHFLEYVTRISFILEDNDIDRKNTIIIRNGMKKLYENKGYKEIVLPCKYNIGSLLIIVLLGLFKGVLSIKTKRAASDILVLPAGNGKIEKNIWRQIAKTLNRKYRLKEFPNELILTPSTLLGGLKYKRKLSTTLRKTEKYLPLFYRILILAQFHNIYRLIKYNPAKIIVAFEQSSPYAGLLSYVSREYEIKTVEVAHAPTFGANYKYSSFDYNLLFGRSSAKSFRGLDSIVCGKLVEIGAPGLDRYFLKPIQHKKWENKILFLPNYAIHGRDDEQIKIMKIVENFILENPEIKLCVKPHPARKNPYIEKFFTKYQNVDIKYDADLLREIDACNVVIIIGWSASGLEVVIRKKPMIRLNIPYRMDWFKYEKFGYAFNANNYEELKDSYVKIRNSQRINCSAREKILYEHLVNHGRAGEKIAQFLDGLN